jgi:histone-lysine N-methyltransferase SETDB1
MSHDIPDGTFVCLYAGEVLTDEKAEEIDTDCDEYLTYLNCIEVIEQKEGYESDVEDNLSEMSSIELSHSDSSDISSTDSEPDDQNFVFVRSKRPLDDGDGKAQAQKKLKVVDYTAFKLVREYFAKNDGTAERPYVLDAKRIGNVGRFLNHSCDANCMLCPVFVDTHDLRFPWMAFFTMRNIPARTELTWNYNYAKGKEKFVCKCGSANCFSKTKLDSIAEDKECVPSL